MSFNAYISPPPATHDSDLRAGAKLGPTDLSFFIKNPTDEHPHLALTETINQALYADFTFRPPTFGVTATYGF